MSLAPVYWSARFARWPAPEPEQEGYTLLMPVPGDLPVFLELALATCATQNSEHRVETIVVPDRPTKEVANIVERHRPGWAGDLRLEPLPMPERVGLPLLRNPSHNHGVQIITGVGRARGSHVVLHDADLFLLAPDALDRHWRQAVDDDLVVAGVDPVWDTWFADHGISLVATWEMCAQRNWLRSFPPYLHMGHVAEILGETHVFDTTLQPQALTDPRRIGLHEDPDGIVHFNYVISTYRHFQRSSSTFLDERFRLLLVRMFVDLFAQEAHDYALPPITALAAGLTDPAARVTYPAPTAEVAAEYRSFRAKIERILTGAWVPAGRGEEVAAALAPFDRHYGV